MAARSVGMNPMGPFAQAIRLMASNTSREEAASLGYVAETLLNTGSGSARFVGEILSPDVTRRISDATMRASLLNYWTDNLRNGNRMEIAAHLAAQAGKRYRDIEPRLLRTFERRGFTEADWNAVRAGPLFQAADGGRFLAPAYFRQAATHLDEARREGLATRLQAIIDEQTGYAVPVASLEARALVVGEARPGTIGGEMLNSFMQFKSYPLTLMLQHIRRAQAQETRWGGARYFLGSFLAGMTIFGAVAIQLKEIAKGRDPRDMTDWKFWGAALMQGGGLGILGDLFYAATTRGGGGVGSTIAGPVVGTLADAGGLVGRAGMDLWNGENEHFGRDVSNFFRRHTPGTSLWYARAALDRIVWDQMQLILDPEAEAAFRRAERRQIQEYGNRSFWERGEMTPERGPDLGNAFGG